MIERLRDQIVKDIEGGFSVDDAGLAAAYAATPQERFEIALAVLTDVARDEMNNYQMRQDFPAAKSYQYDGPMKPAEVSRRGERVVVRRNEKECLDMLRVAVTVDEELACFVRMQDRPFKLANGKKVPWMLATLADFEERDVMLRAQRDGVQETLDLIQKATRLLRTQGANTLTEILDRSDGGQGVAAA